jgi:DNA polymerase-1
MTAKTKNSKSKGDGDKLLRVVILDTHAIIHRAYHALPDFSTSRGEPSGALYGLISMLLRITQDLKPDYLIATRDLPGPTHRHDVYKEYKATRMKADDDLVAQLIQAPRVFEAFGIPMYQAQGFEADDIIGTIVDKLQTREDIEIIIASGDMDTLQLVGPRVRVYTMRKGLTDTVLYDEEAVRERYGFGPEHIIDYKALRGDPSDNIPGIRGIGEKTASDLVREFGSVEHIYEVLKRDPETMKAKGIKPRVIELLTGGEADARFSKQLSTIHAGAPISFELPKLTWQLADHTGSIYPYTEEMEFKSLRDRIRGLVNTGEPKPGDLEDLVFDVPEVDPEALKEVSVALWLLHSDTANPALQDILAFAGTDDFEKAREYIFSKLKSTGRLMEVYEQIEKPLIAVVDRMNRDGIRVDAAYLKKLSREYSKGLSEIAARIYQHAGHEFNINSPKQLGVVLYDELKITPVKQKRTATGARTTREEELAKLSPLHPIIADVLAYRELQKLLSTYIDKIPALIASDGRLHAQFLQAGSSTGRMASQDPNLQNIPIKTEYGRRIRSAFCAAPGYKLVAIDYSQIELRIAAGLSGDKKLVRIFQEGGDVHTSVAAEVFGVAPDMVDREMRRRAKVINFGILYGMGVNALRANLGESISREESAKFLSDYFKKFSGLASYIEAQKAAVAQVGYTETLFGRRRHFPGINSPLPNIRAQAERMAINAPIQGTQSDIIKRAMIETDEIIEKRKWRDKVKLLLQVHDELVYEIAQSDAEKIAREIREVMESVAPVEKLAGVPIVAEASLGDNWGDLKKIPR